MESKIKITAIPNGYLQANSYIVENDDTAVIIDLGEFNGRICEELKKRKQKLQAILLTHRHFDHVCGVKNLLKSYQLNTVIGKDDECGLYSDADSLRSLYSDFYEYADINLRANIIVEDGELLEFGKLLFKVIKTPGHTSGGVSYLLNDKYLFSGDTLFMGSIGRLDLPTGNYEDMNKSLRIISKLDPDIEVYPGHGDATTIGAELENNYYLGR